ncbi:hypothetical protein PCASD_06960 [Puccinia coronata f. sp. avenae]|uniref:Uncharacterized protein n=1 Tax=Puccinia coronata f. sp. avenae TaxID=200324 RepID=A0A2N5V572_9BASI|nr:hypothetical protein PCASD_06960 [Puccinia coronata f. sp. avenae]
MLTSTQPQARTRTIPGGNSQVAGTIAQLRRQAGTSEASAAFVRSLINDFIRTELREIVLRSNLLAYGRIQAGDLTHIALCPVVLMIDAIDQKEITWKKTNLPAGYMEGKHKALSSVQKLVKELLKSMSARYALKAPEINTAMRVRFAYLRLQMLIHCQKTQTWSENSTHWQAIDEHLYQLYSKGAELNLSFAQLIIDINSTLFNEYNTGKDISQICVVLPSDQEVNEATQKRMNKSNPMNHMSGMPLAT